MLPTLAGSRDGSNGGGILRPDEALDAVDWLRWTLLLFVLLARPYGDEPDTVDDDSGDARDADTQSGSLVLPNGFDGRFGFRPMGCPLRPLGTWMFARAGCLLSSHHFCRSELAGGRPGSTAS